MVPKLMILLCCTTICLASHHTHVIPVEGYETELQNLGEHVEIPETPVKVVKITKTVAVKVPIPYPVKVIEKVPYPVHVSKPYPVPVPQIIKVPVTHHQGHEALDVGNGHFQDRQHNSNSYQVQENAHDNQEESFNDSTNQSFDGSPHNNGYSAPNIGDYSAEGASGNYYPQQPQEFQGSAGDLDGHNSFESKSYDFAIQNYLNHFKPNGNHGGQGVYH